MRNTIVLALFLSGCTAWAGLTNVSVGTVPNDGTGDTLRAAMIKVNTNFAYLEGEMLALPAGRTNWAASDITNAPWAVI